MNLENDDTLRTCDECESLYKKLSSQMSSLCPECSHLLYGYPNCHHNMSNGRCTVCYWDGARSSYIKSQLFKPTLDIPENKKKTVLLTIGVLFEVNEDELDDDYNTINYFNGNTRSAIEEEMSIYKKNINLGWVSSRNTILNDASLNCGQCVVCDAWITDMAKPHPIIELDPGFIVENRFLCEDCLSE